MACFPNWKKFLGTDPLTHFIFHSTCVSSVPPETDAKTRLVRDCTRDFLGGHETGARGRGRPDPFSGVREGEIFACHAVQGHRGIFGPSGHGLLGGVPSLAGTAWQPRCAQALAGSGLWERGLCECGAGFHVWNVVGTSSPLPSQKEKTREVPLHGCHTMPGGCSTFMTQDLTELFQRLTIRATWLHPKRVGGCHLAGVRQGSPAEMLIFREAPPTRAGRETGSPGLSE